MKRWTRPQADPRHKLRYFLRVRIITLRGKTLTIAAGFCFQEGILLCADTEQTVGHLKTSDSKIISEEFSDCSVAFAIAGDVAHATSAVQQILSDLRNIQDIRNLFVIERTKRARSKAPINSCYYGKASGVRAMESGEFHQAIFIATPRLSGSWQTTSFHLGERVCRAAM